MVPVGLINVSIGGSFLCDGYELRVTERCLSEDLARPTDQPFDDLASHEIITAFINRRREFPTNTRKVAPLTTGKTVYRLAYGHRHRGATWHDEANRVVWLLVYAEHQFGDQGDAFPYFKALDADERLLPAAADYEALFLDRDRRFAEVVAHEAADLLEAAREAPGQEQRAVVGGQLGVGISIEVVEPLEELYLAVRMSGLTDDNLLILFAAFFPDCTYNDVDSTDAMPGRVLDEDELGFRCLLD